MNTTIPMENILVQQMSQLTFLSPEERQGIRESFPVKTFEKGHYLLKEGMVANDAFFVVKGCIREFKTLNGEEKTTAFYTENQSAINFGSQANGKPSAIYFICTETTTVAILNRKKEEALYQKHPRFESFCREGMEQMMGAQQETLTKFITLSPRERYLLLVDNRPDLINRIPQYQIASYLGIKPETLSRIRRKIMPGHS
ncbi:Crp/Fnr family transcriptional regulator [Neolewinella persica]|uniref:Crp/Fnr family transcriptional regulator n=1 Tax=Neolewinella persica TaxID=70998 RepID=UPI001FDFC430|nr:Crp/Fnr family transcriptional regulator [Neolewinella persica]